MYADIYYIFMQLVKLRIQKYVESFISIVTNSNILYQ